MELTPQYLFYEFAAFEVFPQPLEGYVQGGPLFGHWAHQPRTLVFDVTRATADKFWQTTSEHGVAMIEVARRWARERIADPATLQRVLEACNPYHPPSIVVSIPIPHAVLASRGRWKSHALPAPVGKSAKARMLRYWVSLKRLSSLRRGLPGEPIADDVDDDDSNVGVASAAPQNLLSQEHCQRLANLLRLYMTTISHLDVDLKEEVKYYIVELQSLCDNLVQQSARHATQAYQMDFLISCIVFSGFLSNAAIVRGALLHGLRVVFPSELLQMFGERALQDHGVPSRTQIYYHRLTIHLGWCLVRKASNLQLTEAAQVSVYLTIDSSPQGGYDWLEHSITIIPETEVVDLLRAVNPICLTMHSDAEMPEEALVAAWCLIFCMR